MEAGDNLNVTFDGTQFRFDVIRNTATLGIMRVLSGQHTDQEFAASTALLRQSYATLRQWATDAATANTNWPTMTAAQKDATTREVIHRLGMFMDRFADLLITQNADA